MNAYERAQATVEEMARFLCEENNEDWDFPAARRVYTRQAEECLAIARQAYPAYPASLASSAVDGEAA